MRNTIRCCISCILPCGALDVIRIVHSNGRVEEITGTVRAAQIMKAYPKHVLKKPTSRSHADVDNPSSPSSNMVPRIVVVPPDAELQRGKIYFLIPVSSSSPPEKPRPKKSANSTASSGGRRRRRELQGSVSPAPNSRNNGGRSDTNRSNSDSDNNAISMANLLISDRYLSEILNEKISTQRDRRRGRVGVWRPHLESICETVSETSNDQ